MKHSNSDYKKLGDRIRSNASNISTEDLMMLQDLRLSYKEPLAIVFKSIKSIALKIDSDCVCTYRIKRIESIVSKLLRFSEMQVNRAEDIAGCRCILSTTEHVYELYNRILKKQHQLPFEIKGKINDYIATPKESGYRSIHLNVALKGDNRRIEIQLRCLADHNWATLVEITDLLYDLKLKEHGANSDKELFQLHLLLSKSPSAIKIKDLNYISDTVIKYDYITKLGTVFANNYLEVRRHWNSLNLYKKHFFLIATGTDGIPEISGFSNFKEAEDAYFDMFINNNSNKNIILTHLPKTNFTKINIAYSNYFLTFNNTVVKILLLLSRSIKASFKKNQARRFSRYYQAFLDIMLFWRDKQLIEIDSYQQDNNIKKSAINKNEWKSTIIQGIMISSQLFNETQKELRFSILNIRTYIIMKLKYKKYIGNTKKQ